MTTAATTTSDYVDPDEDELELMIERETELVHSALTREEREAAWIQLKKLHARRSPERIAQMEREAGIQ